MKYLILPAIAISLSLYSCGGSDEATEEKEEKETKNGQVTFDDIKLDDLNEACECVDAIETVLDRLILTSENLREMQSDEADKEKAKNTFLKGQDKISEIGKKCQGELGIKTEAIQNCDAYQSMTQKLQRVKQL
jgi:hypothetical protein